MNNDCGIKGCLNIAVYGLTALPLKIPLCITHAREWSFHPETRYLDRELEKATMQYHTHLSLSQGGCIVEKIEEREAITHYIHCRTEMENHQIEWFRQQELKEGFSTEKKKA